MPRLPFGDIGPCEVHWGYGYQSGYQSGYMPPLVITPYLGKVAIRIADAVTDIHEEGKGIAPIDSFFEGTTVELEVPMVRSTLIQLARTIGWQKMGVLSGSGYELRLDNIAGWDMYANAETMVIKPLCNNVPDPDPHNWIMIYKCHPYRDIELGFDRSGQRIHLVKFKVFPSRDNGYEGAGEGGQYLQEGVAGEGEAFEVTSSNKYLDYEDDIFVVTDSNKYLDFREVANGADRTTTINEGVYTGDDLATEIQTKMRDDGAADYDWLVSYSAITHKFTITSEKDWPFGLHWKTGPHGSVNLDNNIGTLIGFDDSVDLGDAGKTYTSDFANGKTEITASMTEGFYSGATLAAEIELKMNFVAVAYTWQVSYSAVTHKFTITNANSWVFELYWRTGPHGSINLDDHIGTLIGFNDVADDTGANTYISDNEVP